MTNACCRLKLDDVNRNKESELAALRQHTSAIEQQLADSNIVSFYRAMLCIRGTSHGPVSVSVCLCLCLSQACVLLKRQNVGSHKQDHTIPQGL